MGDRLVTFRAVAGGSHDVLGSDADQGVLLSIVHHDGHYGEPLQRALARHAPADGVVVDAGANIGVLSVAAAELVPRGRVIAFEPAPGNLRYLHRNVEGRNVEIVEAALGAADGTLRFDVNDAYPAGAHVAAEGGVEVACRSLDSWTSEQGLDRLDVLKIDVEGAEPQVLEGAAGTIARFRPVVLMECNVGGLRRVAGVGAADLRRQLAGLVPHVGVLLDDGGVLPVDDDEALELALGFDGVVDLIGTWRAPGLRSRLAGRRHLAGLRARLAAGAPPEPHNFVVTPPTDLTATGPTRGRAGEELTFDVTVVNTSRWWLSSDFVYHPVHVGGRWVGGAECGRASFAAPVPPGGTGTARLEVRLPDEPGRHDLEVTLVQEHFSWLVDLEPRCAQRIEVEVDER